MVLKYYDDMKGVPLFDLLRQDRIKTKKKLVVFSDSSWKDCPDTVRSIGAYIIFYQGETINHGTYVTRPAAQSIAESEYNASCTTEMGLSHFSMLNHGLLKKIHI